MVVNCAALRENLDRVQNAKMQIARADLSLGYGGAGGSRACKASGQGQGQGQGIESCFYSLGVGRCLGADSRESLGRAC
ncbi:hypothetical protein [Helicobacter zhangjianzhongii]|uniref:hypothetical protein n=1 Tax=Helicobacter zhangjianzhongii TaxID=2974574 RepID=UPI0025553752|nr:hypothetical protein [Helicobacter sp. CPD2-1]MDL0080491.1 hypothetical protein [Helicobacter sp. CPD2-1]